MTFYKNNIAPVQLIKFAALNSDVDVMAIKPYDVFKSILGIKNSHQNIANNVKSDNCKLTSEKDAALTKPEFSAFITEHLQNVFIAAKNANNPLEKNNLANLTAANNQLHYAGNDIAKFTNQNDGIKVEPTYAAPYDSVEKQQYTSNDVYYDAEGYSIVGQDKHIYEQISDYVLEEGEQMENEIYYDARGENKEHIYDTIPDNFTTDEQRNKITRLAEQTFAPPKSFIARLTSSIWNALFGTKNEPKIVPPAELVARAMQINIDGICHALNKSIAEKEVDGIFRQMPNNSIYKKDDPEKLIKVFNNDDCYSNPIALAWMVKLYINENMSKITTEEFDIIKKQHNKPDKLNCLIKEKIDQINCDKTKNNLKACFTTIVNVLKLGRELEAKGEKNNQFSSVNIVGSMLTGLVKQPEEFVTKELHSEGFFSEGFVAKESYNNEYANKLYAAKQNHNNEHLNYARYIEENKEEISNLVANFLINR